MYLRQRRLNEDHHVFNTGVDVHLSISDYVDIINARQLMVPPFTYRLSLYDLFHDDRRIFRRSQS